jgi:uncharacterized protein (TIGR00369 family)
LATPKDPKKIYLPKLKGYHCFGCGTANPIGLNMSFYLQEDTICSDITLNKNHAGWENIAHGGIISTILDELMAWTVIAFKQVFFVTRSMEIRYLKPVYVGVPLRAKGQVEPGEDRSRSCWTKGFLMDGKGTSLAVARAEMVFLTGKRLELLPEDLRKSMTGLFAQIKNVLTENEPQ